MEGSREKCVPGSQTLRHRKDDSVPVAAKIPETGNHRIQRVFKKTQEPQEAYYSLDCGTEDGGVTANIPCHEGCQTPLVFLLICLKYSRG